MGPMRAGPLVDGDLPCGIPLPVRHKKSGTHGCRLVANFCRTHSGLPSKWRASFPIWCAMAHSHAN